MIIGQQDSKEELYVSKMRKNTTKTVSQEIQFKCRTCGKILLALMKTKETKLLSKQRKSVYYGTKPKKTTKNNKKGTCTQTKLM